MNRVVLQWILVGLMLTSMGLMVASPRYEAACIPMLVSAAFLAWLLWMERHADEQIAKIREEIDDLRVDTHDKFIALKDRTGNLEMKTHLGRS